jgi:hypothetical protein
MPRPRPQRKGKRQRFYARTAVKTTLTWAFGRLMRAIWATRGNPFYPTRIHPALNSFADECCGMLARLFAYMGVLALMAILGFHLWDLLPDVELAPAAKAEWSVATRSYPAFAVSQFDLSDKTEAYEILRHPDGGRKDVFRWAQSTKQGTRPVAELEIYRPGAEFSPSVSTVADLAARIDPQIGPKGARDLEAAGVIDSKFGSVTLLRVAGNADDAPSCLGFMKRIDAPNLRISGWSCQGDTLPARRAAIGCMLDRLILLTSGNEPKLAELFAHAELKRGSCALSATAAATTADWVTGAENPRLRGAF